MNTEQELGARIRALRKERGLSQEALAETLEVSRQAVTKWEDGSSLPSTANLFALSGFFGVSIAALTGTPEESAAKPPHKRARQKCAWVTFLLCAAALIALPVRYFVNTPHIPQGETIIGYADGATDLYVVSGFPTGSFLLVLVGFAAAGIYLLRSKKVS